MTNEPIVPKVLVVDDSETSSYGVGFAGNARARTRHPNDVELEDLKWADLVLMDFRLEQWAARDQIEQLSLRPSNGLALAAILREHVDSSDHPASSYTAFAIHTAHIGEISCRLHTSNQAAHVVARLNNLEWAFDKADPSRFECSIELASAVRAISESWNRVETHGIEQAIELLLGLTTEPIWYSRAYEDVVLCQPPLSDFSTRCNGLLFLRWLLHSILPYPTFLWGAEWVAARLRITPATLRSVVAGQSKLAKDLSACRYKGILSSFNRRRWWRAAVEQYAWDMRAGGARSPEEFHRELEDRAGEELQRLTLSSPVVCVDRDLQPAKDLCSLDETVRLVPDLWPAYADSAYTRIVDLHEDPDLSAVVHPLDRDRIQDQA